MTAQTIDHATLSTLVEAGMVRNAHVVGRPEGWSIQVRYGQNQRTLIAQRGRHARVFRRLDTLVSYLKDVGIAEFDVDATAYEPDSAKAPTRPDRSEALRKAHEAAAYDAWFREEIQKAIDEADDPNTVWISQEEADADWEKQRAELTRLIGDKG
ncbi:hypothetical protein GCM10007874_20590 [Labrys miyagiensis]|uniref:Prevent host death protein, Phd antitoxin n=1 Tax=Labrys miyagiensis TaxID=346912 RepID=A0ABQ6CHE1_9HYPH|nr:hypothetical protein [Labrys miyagiensis]GLS19042.1 hypothetical protein GCM10007874_20590 [Labrys miyagiensis]